MSVLDQSYRRGRGRPTPYLERMLVIPRYDALEILSRLGWSIPYALTLLPPLVLAASVYIASNAGILAALIPGLKGLHLPLPGPVFWCRITGLQVWLIFAFALLVGPELATRDFANGALPLYLSKALRRPEYVLGRWAILLVLLSAASWVPLLLVFGLELALAPSEWRSANAWLGPAVLLATVPVVLLFTALVSAIAALVHRTNVVRATLLAIVLLTWPVGKMLQFSTGSPRALVVSPMAMAATITSWAFEPSAPDAVDGAPAPAPAAPRVPVMTAFLVVGLWFGSCLLVLARRVKAVEVVK